jgi:cyclic lactone autoinducer peptide
MKTVKGWFVRVASSVAALAFIVAIASAGSACFFTAYQPDVPESMR